ncbi:MAG: hypothetical protein ABW184_00510 [Sphingobium sp.]
MTETGWIIILIAAFAIIVVAVLLLRRKPTTVASRETPVRAPDAVAPPVTPAPDIIAAMPLVHTVPEPEFVAPAPVVTPEPATPEAIPPERAEVVEPTFVPTTPSLTTASEGDNLLLLKGVGPKIVAILHAEGITRFAQIAAWADPDVDAIDAKLGAFKGRPVRDNWVDQAALLAAHDIVAFEAKYGKL